MDVEVSKRGLGSRLATMAGWAILVYCVQVVGHIVLASFFTESTDPCNLFYESPNNVGGWSIASVTVLIPTTIGVKLRKHVPLTWVLLGMVAQIYLFVRVILLLGLFGSC